MHFKLQVIVHLLFLLPGELLLVNDGLEVLEVLSQADLEVCHLNVGVLKLLLVVTASCLTCVKHVSLLLLNETKIFQQLKPILGRQSHFIFFHAFRKAWCFVIIIRKHLVIQTDFLLI